MEKKYKELTAKQARKIAKKAEERIQKEELDNLFFKIEVCSSGNVRELFVMDGISIVNQNKLESLGYTVKDNIIIEW